MPYYLVILTATIEIEATTADNIVDALRECEEAITEAVRAWGDTTPYYKVNPPEEWKQDDN